MEKRNLLLILIVLYFLSLIAALYLIFQAPPPAMVRKPIPTFAEAPLAKEGIALLKIYGPISISRGLGVPHGIDVDRLVKRLQDLREKPEIKAVVLRINSPGGSVGSVQEIYSEIKKLSQAGKIVVASLGDVGASGGYYLACAADKIVANPGTLTGSIGVILELPNLNELFKKIGVKIVTVKSGKYKDIGSYTRELTPEEKEILQSLINDAYEQFVNSIVEGRKIERERVLEFADGRIFTGTQGLKMGLVDRLGALEEAIKLAADLAGIKGKPKIVTEIEPWEKIMDFFRRSSQEEKFSLPDILREQKVRFEYILE